MDKESTGNFFHDHPDANVDHNWASSPGRRRHTTPQTAISTPSNPPWTRDEFLDDFDDDDDAFFNSGSVEDEPAADATKEDVDKTMSSTDTTFGMLSLTYDSIDASAIRSSGPAASPTAGETSLPFEDEDIDDDTEFIEFDKRHLIHLRDVESSYRTVARSCLVIHQWMYSNEDDSCQDPSPLALVLNNNDDNKRTMRPLLIQSSSILHMQRFHRRASRILSSLTTCLAQHSAPACRRLMAHTLACVARATYAKLLCDPRIMTELPPCLDRLQEDCLAVAHSLIVAALEDGDDCVSSSAVEALGVLTLDSNESLSVEIRSIAECIDPNGLVYEHGSRIVRYDEHATMKEIQFKVWSNGVFPRMSRLLQRMSLYVSRHHVARVIPLLTAVFVHALREGPETMPQRRAMRTGKVSHAKRGWMETDAVGLVREYVEMLLSLLEEGGDVIAQRGLHRGVAVSCIRLSEACPLASWIGKASRCAVSTLTRQLNEETAILLPSLLSVEKESMVDSPEAVSSTLSSAVVPPEIIAGMVALLLVALRGIPLNERASGLISALRAVLLFLPMAVPIPREGCGLPDVPVSFIPGDGKCNAHRLGRIGLLTEIAILVMIDGNNNNMDHLKADEFLELQSVPSDIVGTDKDSSKEKILGSRAMLLNQILQSYHLSPIWDSQQKKNFQVFRPVDEMIWTFCSVLLQIGRHREHAFSKDFSFVVEWSNLGLVMVDNFGKFICRPSTPSPFSHAARAAFTDLLAILKKRSGLYPPSTLSIRDNMLPYLLLTNNDATITSPPVPNTQGLSVVGGPGRQMPHVSSALSKISQNILILWSKARTAYSSGEEGSPTSNAAGNIVLAAIIVDAWLGRCVINHDTKQSNEGQLEVAPNLLSHIQAEMTSLLESLRVNLTSKGMLTSLLKEDPSTYFNANVHLFRICMASLEAVANMSVILWDMEIRKIKGDVEALENKVGPLAVSILQSFISSSREALDLSANEGRDVMILSLYQQVAIDAGDAAARIEEFSSAHVVESQTHHDDIAMSFQPSPLTSSREGLKGRRSLENMLRMILNCSGSIHIMKHEKKAAFNEFSSMKELPPTLMSQVQPIHQCAFVLYHHARLVVTRLVANAVTASALAFPPSPAAPKRVHPLSPHRLSSLLQHSVIETYRRPRDLPILIPVQSDQSDPSPIFIDGNEPVALTGCSDPVSLTMTYDVRRIRRADLSEQFVLIVTMMLYNLTPVPICNGVRVDLRASQEFDAGSGSVATALYKHEIKGGDFVMWESCFGSFSASNLSLQASITFRDMEKESVTRKWVSLGGTEGEHGKSDVFAQDDEDEETTDVTVLCQSVTISAVQMLQPCPLVYFGSRHKDIQNGVGDDIAFRFLWSNMNLECSKHFLSTDEVRFDVKCGCVALVTTDAITSSSGCAFVTPDGVKVLCLLERTGNDSHSLRVRSDSTQILQSLTGTVHSQSYFITFLFGPAASSVLKSSADSLQPKLEHDFPSMTMVHRPVNVSQ
ncbi:hypothetical protein HJC23_004701 [Cyclotella cryptica]|uniref:Uncharacterized protein n=1 Tax=Cyclotella cryptica TaxID=29204 RepID=A0ABD3PXC2_9STRA